MPKDYAEKMHQRSSALPQDAEQEQEGGRTMAPPPFQLFANPAEPPQSPPDAPSNPNETGMSDQLKSGVEQLSGHDMSDVRVHRNSDKPAQLQAHAFAQGSEIHLASGQEKHLPHEAWHVAQQKSGRVQATTQLKGVGVNDDSSLEKEADVMGAKAMGMKGEAVGKQPAQQAEGGEVVQRMAVRVGEGGGSVGRMGSGPIQRVMSVKVTENGDAQSCGTVGSLFEVLGISLNQGILAIVDALVASELFSEGFKEKYATEGAVKKEVYFIANSLSEFMRAYPQETAVVFNSKDPAEVAKIILGEFKEEITPTWLGTKSKSYLAEKLGQSGDDYKKICETLDLKVRDYKSKIDAIENVPFDKAQIKGKLTEKAGLEKKQKKLVEKFRGLNLSLSDAAFSGKGIPEALASFKEFEVEFKSIEASWNIDMAFEDNQKGIEKSLANQKTSDQGKDLYGDKGADDGLNVKDKYDKALACSLFALLAVLPSGWFGLTDPEELHNALRRTQHFCAYDDTEVAAKIRLAAGLKQTAIEKDGKKKDYLTLKEYVKKCEDEQKCTDFIADLQGKAHTLAICFKGGKGLKVDNDSPGGNADLGDSGNKKLLFVWKA